MSSSRQNLVTDNLGLVHMCVRRFADRGEEYEDLFQIGCIGLVKAAENFDPELGYKFSTYAVSVILGELRSSFRSGRLVHVSRGLKNLSAELAELTEQLTESLGRPPTVSELSEKSGVTPEKVAQAITAALPVSSLSSFFEDGDEVDIPDKHNDIDRLTERMSLRQCVESLDEKDRQLIELRYCMSKTQKETAEILGSNQVQVSRREKKILLWLRGVLI